MDNCKKFSQLDGPNILNLGILLPRDLNKDNGVNIIDVSVANAAFGSTSESENYNYLADMNCNGGGNIIDISILNASFGMVGPQP